MNDDGDEFDIETFRLMLPLIEEMGIRAEAVREARVHWLASDEGEAVRLRHLSRIRPLTGDETRLLMYEDGSADLLGCSAPPSVCWRALRKAVRARAIAMYWLQITAEKAYAPGGVGRLRDRDAFVADTILLP